MQSVFYLLQFSREDICQDGTNKFFWKKAKKHFNESFLDRLLAYSPLGLKALKQHAYTTVNFLEKQLDGLTQEEVDLQAGLPVGKLFKWLKLCLQTRKDDITYRKAQRKRAILNRETLI
jgi:hypothetical protein